MSTTTSTLNLVKPASSEHVDLSVINSNYDKIDQFAGSVVNGDYVEDASYVHTDNNFTTNLKNKLDGVEANANNYSLPTASTSTLGGVKVDGTTVTINGEGVISAQGGGGGGTTVIANPSGSATEALEKLQVGSTIYSSGGTTVIANPSGTATGDLEKVQIGNGVYEIPVGSEVEANPILFISNGTTYNVSITLEGTRTAVITSTQYVNGAETSTTNVNLTRGSSAEDFHNFNAQYDTDGVYVKSKINSVRFGNIIAGANGLLFTCNPQGTAQTYALEEGNASPSVATLQTIGIDDTLYKLPSGGSYTPTGVEYVMSVPVATGQWNGYAMVTQYTNGVMTSQDALTYGKMASGTSNITVGYIKCESTRVSGISKFIFTALTDSIECDGNIYNTNDVVAEFDITSYPNAEFTKKALKVTTSGGGSSVSWNQIQDSGTKIAEITIDGTSTDVYAPNGSGGSTVSVTQKTSTGTNIADITVDGVTTQLYAPTSGGATALNDLSDVNINYGTLGTLNVLQYDSATAKWGNAEIPRNLASQGDVTISSATNGQVLKYNSTSNKWENSNESGGTTVVANPQETATDELEKIQIGNIIYSVSSGGGGGTGSGKTLVKKTKTYTGDGQIPLVVTFDEKPLLIYSIYGPGLNESNTVRMYPFVYGETKASGRYINNDSSSGNIGYTIAYSNNDLTMSVTSNPGDAGACLNNNGSSFTITYLVEENTSSGHTILNDGGTALAQEDNLQFKGAYVHDDSTNEKTIVEVTRTMTLAQYQALSDAEKKGVIAVTDDSPSPDYTDVVGTLTAGSTSITLSDASITTSSTVEVFDEFDIPYNNKTLSNGSITLTFDAQQNDMIVKVRVS